MTMLTSRVPRMIPPDVYRIVPYHGAGTENHRPNLWEDQVDEWMQEIEVREYLFEDDARIPNNPTLPLLVYPQALDGSEQDSLRCKELLAENGWGGTWVDGVFSYHHYHSNAHEVLCVVGGSASIAFGGPEGETVEVVWISRLSYSEASNGLKMLIGLSGTTTR